MAISQSQTTLARRRRTWTAVLAAALGLFAAGALLEPLLHAAGLRGAGLLRLAYFPFCHQIPERSLAVAGHPAAVCARCLGLYLGAFVAMVLAAWSGVRPERTPRWWFFALCVPTALDALAPWIGLAGLSNVPRFLLAGPTGFILGWFLAAAVRDRAAMGLERRPSARAPAARARSA